MNTFESLVNKKLKPTEPAQLEQIFKAQARLGINLPSDYCYLLMNSNGYSLEAYEITIDGEKPIVEVGDFVNLEWLIKEREYDLEDENAEIYRDKFLNSSIII